jgi:tetratricopeptide (TPR) repeat protein
VNLGIAYETTARYPESAEAFQQAVRIDPNNVSALNGLGIAQFHMGQREQGNRKDADVQLYRQNTDRYVNGVILVKRLMVRDRCA